MCALLLWKLGGFFHVLKFWKEKTSAEWMQSNSMYLPSMTTCRHLHYWNLMKNSKSILSPLHHLQAQGNDPKHHFAKQLCPAQAHKSQAHNLIIGTRWFFFFFFFIINTHPSDSFEFWTTRDVFFKCASAALNEWEVINRRNLGFAQLGGSGRGGWRKSSR